MENIFKDLNDKQIEAVRATEGPVLILASAARAERVKQDIMVVQLLL